MLVATHVAPVTNDEDPMRICDAMIACSKSLSRRFNVGFSEAYPGPDLRKVAAKVAGQSREKLRKVAKVAEGRGRSRNKRCHMNQSFIFISNNFDKVAQPSSQTKVAESRGWSHKVAQRRVQPWRPSGPG
jgi:hypothetical protein